MVNKLFDFFKEKVSVGATLLFKDTQSFFTNIPSTFYIGTPIIQLNRTRINRATIEPSNFFPSFDKD